MHPLFSRIDIPNILDDYDPECNGSARSPPTSYIRSQRHARIYITRPSNGTLLLVGSSRESAQTCIVYGERMPVFIDELHILSLSFM